MTDFKPGGFKPTGLAAIRQAAKHELLAQGKSIVKTPDEMEHRIGIVFDDSGSMSPLQIEDAHVGIEEFLRSCTKDQTAVTIQPLNAVPLYLSSDLPALSLLVKSIRATGGTPLVKKLNEMLSRNKLTRAIVFSDGSPNTYQEADYEKILGFHIPIDTVYISDSQYKDQRAIEFMRKLAKDTDGYYLEFERGKSNFRTAFKYLSPGLRYMLADKSFVNKLEGK